MSALRGPTGKSPATAAIHDGPAARKLMSILLPTIEDFDAFCMDYYSATYRRFPSGIDRVGRENILLSVHDASDVIYKLKAAFPDKDPCCDSINRSQYTQNPSHTFSGDDPEDDRFSDLIIKNLAKFYKIINTLTTEQYHVLDFLRAHRRASIAGCAGSGKTLVAAEKSIRMARAGISTLMLCHNPLLACRLRELVRGSGVEVFDFENWIHHLLQQNQRHSGAWSPWAEPTETEISMAFATLAHTHLRYDAIIVDEGQDFRELWWLLVEAALRDEKNGFLYVFYDERQALLPHRSRPQLRQAPYYLSRNCRNAGKIYQLIRRYDDSAPEPTQKLATLGTVRSSQCLPHGERKSVSEAVIQALNDVPLSNLVILTAESKPASESILNGISIELAHVWRWQDVVLTYLNSIISTGALLSAKYFPQPMSAKKKGYRVNPDESMPVLSNGCYPTPDDIVQVSAWASRLAERQRRLPGETGRRGRVAGDTRPRWTAVGQRLYLSGRMTPEKLLEFFRHPEWADELPRPRQVRIVAEGDATAPEPQIPLFSVGAFKGLEADGVIFYEPAGLAGHSALRYVGISRARWLLHLVVAAA
ncbi:MAG TPA: hypothetical protein PKI03_15180 [Pseudomonadota bacterium]|nr:hypothetical protein [Pseudomonadota bacterium]